MSAEFCIFPNCGCREHCRAVHADKHAECENGCAMKEHKGHQCGGPCSLIPDKRRFAGSSGKQP